MAAIYSVRNIYLNQYSDFNILPIIEKFHTGVKLDETMLALLFEGFLDTYVP
jgi:hypothetical protein